MSYNKVMILGRVGQTPELKQSTTGKSYCSYSVATNEYYKDGEEWKERTEWINVITYGRDAEICAERLGKGDTIFVEGRLHTFKSKRDNEPESSKTVINSQKVIIYPKDNSSTPD